MYHVKFIITAKLNFLLKFHKKRKKLKKKIPQKFCQKKRNENNQMQVWSSSKTNLEFISEKKIKKKSKMQRILKIRKGKKWKKKSIPKEKDEKNAKNRTTRTQVSNANYHHPQSQPSHDNDRWSHKESKIKLNSIVKRQKDSRTTVGSLSQNLWADHRNSLRSFSCYCPLSFFSHLCSHFGHHHSYRYTDVLKTKKMCAARAPQTFYLLLFLLLLLIFQKTSIRPIVSMRTESNLPFFWAILHFMYFWTLVFAFIWNIFFFSFCWYHYLCNNKKKNLILGI